MRERDEFAAAERRARTYLARHGYPDQTERDVQALLRENPEKRE